MKVRLAGIINSTIKNGFGIRKVLFAQGCKHNCKGCFNPETHSMDGGVEYDTSDLIQLINKDFIIEGVTFSGGDPFEQAVPFAEIAKGITHNIWCYTGYKFEYILKNRNNNPGWNELLLNIDYLVDGKYEQDKYKKDLKFRGSYNQRVINVKESLEKNSIILVCV